METRDAYLMKHSSGNARSARDLHEEDLTLVIWPRFCRHHHHHLLLLSENTPWTVVGFLSSTFESVGHKFHEEKRNNFFLIFPLTPQHFKIYIIV